MDYEPENYEEYQDAANLLLQQSLKLVSFLVVRSMSGKIETTSRAQLSRAVAGGYFKTYGLVLWDRIQERRNDEMNAKSALDRLKELFNKNPENFVHPDGEGEVVVECTE